MSSSSFPSTIMDSRQPVTKRKRRKRNNDVNSILTHSMETRSKTQNAVAKIRKQETDPLKMGHILEKIFSFLDANSIKAARQVNPLWSIEGAKSLFTKCYVKIPQELQAGGSSTRNTIMDKFKLFLSHKSIQNIYVETIGDLKLWKSSGVLEQQVKSLRLKMIDTDDASVRKRNKLINDQAKLLLNLVNSLPSLKYLDFDDKYLYENRTIIEVIICAMSKREQDGRLLIISSMVLEPYNEKGLTDMGKLSDCKIITIENLEFYMYPSNFSNVPNINVHLTNVLSKLLLTSQNAVKKLTMYKCLFYLSLIEFPCMPALVHMNLKFDCNSSNEAPCWKFSPSFRFSKKMPNLQEISIDCLINGDCSPVTDVLQNLLESTGTAPSVKRVNRTGCYMDNGGVDALFRTFTNTEELKLHVNCNSESKFRSLWSLGKNLKKLTLYIKCDPSMKNFPDLDILFTGFDTETVNKIKESPNLDPFTPEELEKLRVNPSISNLKELEQLSINFINVQVTNCPTRMLTVAAKYEISQLPKKPKIFITCEYTSGLRQAFDEVSSFKTSQL